jgi:hypothetical protein
MEAEKINNDMPYEMVVALRRFWRRTIESEVRWYSFTRRQRLLRRLLRTLNAHPETGLTIHPAFLGLQDRNERIDEHEQ